MAATNQRQNTVPKQTHWTYVRRAGRWGKHFYQTYDYVSSYFDRIERKWGNPKNRFVREREKETRRKQARRRRQHKRCGVGYGVWPTVLMKGTEFVCASYCLTWILRSFLVSTDRKREEWGSVSTTVCSLSCGFFHIFCRSFIILLMEVCVL